mgnify:CR=1 FL=1
MLYEDKTQTKDLITVDDIKVTPMNEMSYQGAIQSKNKYVTAMQVMKPRNLNKVISKCVEEASIAGEEFIYSWRQGGSIIEGLTIGAALSIVRNFGNSMVEVEVEEKDKAYIFTAYFCDLETGFNISRSYRQNKASPKSKSGKDIYEGERGTDIIFQIGQSKAIRNVVLNAVPRWLASKVLEEAKNNAMATINNMGEVKARELLLNKIETLQIDKSKVENNFGKSKSWDKVKLVQLSAALKSIENGYEEEETLFPDTQTMKVTEQKPTNNTTNKRARDMKLNQEILACVQGDYKQGCSLLERYYGRKFKLNSSFSSQLSEEEIESLDGKVATILQETEQAVA